jgi:hypothetical protein
MVNPLAPDHYAVGWARPSRRRAHRISEGAGWRSNSPRLPISLFTCARLRIDRDQSAATDLGNPRRSNTPADSWPCPAD